MVEKEGVSVRFLRIYGSSCSGLSGVLLSERVHHIIRRALDWCDMWLVVPIPHSSDYSVLCDLPYFSYCIYGSLWTLSILLLVTFLVLSVAGWCYWAEERTQNDCNLLLYYRSDRMHFRSSAPISNITSNCASDIHFVAAPPLFSR